MNLHVSIWRTLFTATLIASMGLVGCASTEEDTTPETFVPNSNQATLIESISASELLVRSKGIGGDMSAARKDARRAAVWFVLYGGSHPVLPDADAREAFSEHEEEIFRDADMFITDYSQPLSSRQDGDDRVVAKEVRVDVERLSEELVRRGVIRDRVDLMADVGRPTVAVVPAEAEAEDRARPAIAMISEYLQERGFDVEVPRAGEQINEIVSQAAALGGDTDPMYQLALQTGSDVYIAVGVEESTRQVGGNDVLKSSVSAIAYYTASGDQIGATTGHSPERDVSGHGVLAEEAAAQAANRITRQIDGSWLEEAERGRPYKVVITTDAADSNAIGREVHMMMREVCPESRRNAAGQTSFDYTLRCTEQNDAMDLLIDLERLYAGPGSLQRVLDSGALLILRAGEGSASTDEITIH